MPTSTGQEGNNSKPRCKWCDGPCHRGDEYCCRRHRANAERTRSHAAVLAAFEAVSGDATRLAKTLGVSVQRARQLVGAAQKDLQKREQTRVEPPKELRTRPTATPKVESDMLARPLCPYCGQALQLDTKGGWYCPPGDRHAFRFVPLPPGKRPDWLPVWTALGRTKKGGGKSKSRQKGPAQQKADAWRRRKHRRGPLD